MKIRLVRGRAAAAAVASLALVGTGAVLGTTPAQSEPVAGDCATAYPPGELARAENVTGLTVVEGTEPVEFTGSYLGAVSGGIAPGIDMLMVDVDFGDDDYNRIGIWQGMSGSPVYAEGGQLIGAVAYGLAWGPSTVAGITPFEAMDDYLGGPAPTEVGLSARQARAVAKATDVSRAQASGGFAQLPMRTGLSGLPANRLQRMRRKGPDYLHLKGVRAASGGTAAAAGPDALVAGGNLGAAFSYGDITYGGVGTVTSVCDGELIGFGHPMTFSGKTSLGMMPADAVYIQNDPVGPGFKVANMGAPAGTIDQDRLTGISGDLGVLPEEADVTSIVTYGDRTRSGTSHSLSRDYDADVAFSQILANHDRVVDAIMGGSETASVSVSGTDAEGADFELGFSDRYTSRWDVSFESIFDTADVVWLLSRMSGVTVGQVTSDADVTDSTSAWKVAEVQQRRRGGWVTLGRRAPALAKAGGQLRLRVLLRGGGGPRRVPVTVRVPRNAKQREGALEVRGGASSWNRGLYRAKTPAALAEALDTQVRNDEVEVSLHLFKRRHDTVVTEVSGPQDRVVQGRRWTALQVRR